ncbi:hypothetical protein M2459_002250 [Parabacteroides sp. PF5-5]|uniref:hypothetical protein n=1 Tax=unclassified Parabacteroides TaxID=2649774 RepID=UPI002474C329|nr:MULTISPECIES: hypothetical protein [unclassified Parabacteroides]MDH6305153.1 hypothetical protein [Parabacteroides sp. PH5-39]MDH6316503.1 hypothetical protein [Parabacteroides sp. PF5-13]MDH6320013.1 hypothetical protein [Parabacteroides sp. PH5-13]MDH6323754.1 hypothetical protein [Parabacteroides sp. PH5-8]MDH6327690.1 hypothetical protein [Parabacteroides sp. PH5-41]
MKWFNKTLLLACCLLAFCSCGGDDDDESDDINTLHHYRVEFETEGDKSSYLMQVTINCLKEYSSILPNKYVDITMDGKKIDQYWKKDVSLYHFAQSTTPYPNEMHNFVFGKLHTFETVDKGVLLTLHVSNSALVPSDMPAPESLTTVIRIYRDNKLVDETKSTISGRGTEFVYGPKEF